MSTDISRMDAARSGANAASSVDYATFPNAMPASQDAAPRLGRAYATGTASQRDVYECMKELGYQMGEAEAARVWNAIGLMLKDRMPEDGRAYDLGFVRFFPALTGTFDSADAPFDPSRNRLYVAAAPSAEIRDALIDGTPTRIGEMADNEARIDNVTWGDGTDRNTLKNGETFVVCGPGLSVGLGGEHAELALPDGSAIQVELSPPETDEGLNQRLSGRLLQPVEACDGAVLRVWTHGFSRDAPLVMVASRRLTVLAGEEPPVPTNPPHIERGWSSGHPDEFDLVYAGEGFVMQGQNLDTATVTVSSSSDHGETWENEQRVPEDMLVVDGDKVEIDGGWLDVWYNNLELGDYVKFYVENAAGDDNTQRQLSA